ncbi:hypothetical protein J5N97_001622 [Dioscorea zingiberensis]|uniref:Wall-associated receptor kinase galacturonan-binding domain-containing protein n=1 Tax=Dioscorea zingiberensis TaxID=325984 RepID=A0A9D5BTI2_9LILI|nr:hypothetical protein J5N97_001622 [Dioscorea zingiberensis]
MYFLLIILSLCIQSASSQSGLCRRSCGGIPIKYPLSIDEGCGSPYYRNMLACGPNSTELRLRTPSGTYPVKSINYADPHMVIYDPSMWSCHADGTPAPPFSLDTKTRFTALRPRASTSSSTAGKNPGMSHKKSNGLIAGTATVVSFAGVASIGALVWRFKQRSSWLLLRFGRVTDLEAASSLGLNRRHCLQLSGIVVAFFIDCGWYLHRFSGNTKNAVVVV